MAASARSAFALAAMLALSRTAGVCARSGRLRRMIGNDR